MKNEYLDDLQKILDVRTVEDVARRALALGALLGRQDAELDYQRDDPEGCRDVGLYYSPDLVGSWLFETGLITSLNPYEIKYISKPFGSWDFCAPDYSLDFYIPFQGDYRRLEILLWALSFLPDIPGEEPGTPRSPLVEVGNSISPFISSARLLHPFELRVAQDYARSVLLDCASKNPSDLRYLGFFGYRIPWQSRIKLMGDNLNNCLDRQLMNLNYHLLKKGITAQLHFKHPSPNCPPEEAVSFYDAFELYCTLAWILDDRRDWDCRQVS